MSEWIDHKSPIVPVGVLKQLQIESVSEADFQSRVQKYLDSLPEPFKKMGGHGEPKIKYRIIPKGEN